MEYSPFKAKYTAIVLSAARRAPYLFPSRIKNLSSDAGFSSSLRSNKPLRHASLFYDPQQNIKLKGISFVIELTHEDIEKARSWQERCKPLSIDRRHLNAFYSRSYLSAPRENVLGQVSFNGLRPPHVLDNVDVGSEIFGCCVLSLVHVPSGSAYLNLYIATREEFGAELQKMDISTLRPIAQLESLNPFSKKSLILHFSMDNLAEIFVRERIKKIQEEALRCAVSVLERMKIAVSSERYIFKAWDFINNAEVLELPELKQLHRAGAEDPDEFIYKSYLRPMPSEIVDKSIHLDFGDSKDCYNLMMVKSKKLDSFKSEVDRSYFQNATALIFESALVISLTEHVYSKSNRQRELLESHIGFKRDIISAEEKQSSLYKIIQNLTAARDEIGHLSKYRSWICPEEYLGFYSNRLEAIKSFSEKILERAELEYKFINDAIGMKVVRSNTTYSRVLGVFALIQIVLAYFAVDWSKQNGAAEPISSAAAKAMTIVADTYNAMTGLIF